MKKKILAGLLAGTLLLSSLSGCGQGNKQASTQESNVTASQSTESTLESESDVSETDESAVDDADETQNSDQESEESTEIDSVTNETDTKLQDLLEFYEYWKPRYVVKNEYSTDKDQYYVWYDINKYKGNNVSVPMTVSEAHGYGMLTMVMMDSFDPEAHDIFDGMVRYYNAHRSCIGPHLMAWIQSDNGSALIDGDDGSMESKPTDSATDGDMDVAYALLCADKVWGSDGEFDYKTMAVDMINDIMTYEISPETYLPLLGDWAYGLDASSRHYNGTRSSDFLMTHFLSYYNATQDERWMKVYDNTYALIKQGVEDYKTGLLPDFWQWNDSEKKYYPADAYFLEDISDSYYGYNSCRTPWRIGTDYLISKNETAKEFADAIDSFICESCNGKPGNIVAGYKLDGTKANFEDALCFTVPFLLTAKCAENKEWEDALYMRTIKRSRDSYFGDCIKMIVLLVYNDIYMVP
ncbi:MAG: hypothetical protein K6F84_08545 [Lachnospiraceae bacterium]|nr:hypothetical protein [Lachnospiraceae bacterium]